MEKRLSSISLPPTLENGDRVRELFFSFPSLSDYITGVILYESSLSRKTEEGKVLSSLLEEKNILLGVKVDGGIFPLLGKEKKEKISRGLDSLEEKLSFCVSSGVSFTKWRSVFSVENVLENDLSLYANAHTLSQYALMVQEKGMVPIIEPEILYSGTHSLSDSLLAHKKVLSVLFETLTLYGVHFPYSILKSSMVLPGKESGVMHTAKEIAEKTLEAFEESLPKELGGIVFLSGGQSPSMATENLDALIKAENNEWPMTFSYSRAIEEEALLAWEGDDAKKGVAYDALKKRCDFLSSAQKGEYEGEERG
jgi:fructose-bisphosphate aldolase, class I